MSDESTAWLAPSLMTTRTSDDRARRCSGPSASIDLKPFSTAEMNSRGIEPPTIVVDELEVACSHGSM